MDFPKRILGSDIIQSKFAASSFKYAGALANVFRRKLSFNDARSTKSIAGVCVRVFHWP